MFVRGAQVGIVLLTLLTIALTGRPVAQDRGLAGRDGEQEDSLVDRPGDRSLLAGTWDYNAEASIDVLTGRTEQGPESATQRGSAARLPGVGPTGRGRGGDSARSLAVLVMRREARDLARDLLEVPETLTFELADESVTITDDLDRTWTYRTDGQEEQQQIAASRFDVRTTWLNDQLRQEITSSSRFEMDQTYFVSADGQRLFVIIRIGEPDDDESQPGYDRVYDRVSE